MMFTLIYICVLSLCVDTARSTVCHDQYKGSCINFRYSSCLTGQYNVQSGCGADEMCCYPGKVTQLVPAIRPNQCGLSTPQSAQHTNKIVGGTVASPGEYPWQVSLRNFGSHVCGGILIDKDWVLTAAHCFRENHNPRAWTVVVGENDRAFVEGQEKIIQVDTLFVHRNFEPVNYVDDIAMMKLTEEVDVTAYVRPVCLPPAGSNFTLQTCVITGWGAAFTGGHGTHALYKANIPVLAQSVCTYLLDRTIPNTMICAGFKQGGVDTCQGDSGGPLVCDVGGVYQVAGIVSWGYSCAEQYTPGVYTNVPVYIDWIHSVLTAYDPQSPVLAASHHASALFGRRETEEFRMYR